MAMSFTPLCPAGHLPLKGGDQPSIPLQLVATVARLSPTSKLLISPLEGEMSGRTEGGAIDSGFIPFASSSGLSRGSIPVSGRRSELIPNIRRQQILGTSPRMTANLETLPWA